MLSCYFHQQDKDDDGKKSLSRYMSSLLLYQVGRETSMHGATPEHNYLWIPCHQCVKQNISSLGSQRTENVIVTHRLVWGVSTVMLRTQVPGLPLTTYKMPKWWHQTFKALPEQGCERTLHAPRAASRVPLLAPVLRNCWSILTTPLDPAIVGQQGVSLETDLCYRANYSQPLVWPSSRWSGHCFGRDLLIWVRELHLATPTNSCT